MLHSHLNSYTCQYSPFKVKFLPVLEQFLMKVMLYCQQAGNTTITEGQKFPSLTLSMEI
jgi:hypothetical protein